MSGIKFRYRRERGPLGLVLRPVAGVIIDSGPQRLEAMMYIDSGADITTVPLGAGVALGFEKDPRGQILEMRGVSGGGVPYLIKEVHLIFEKLRIPVRIAWALIEEVPFLLGRLDVFTKFDITFQENRGIIQFDPLFKTPTASADAG